MIDPAHEDSQASKLQACNFLTVTKSGRGGSAPRPDNRPQRYIVSALQSTCGVTLSGPFHGSHAQRTEARYDDMQRSLQLQDETEMGAGREFQIPPVELNKIKEYTVSCSEMCTVIMNVTEKQCQH